MKKNTNIKKIVIVLLFSGFALNSAKQLIVINTIREESVVKNQELERLKESNNRLAAELEKAQIENDYIEKLARERLGLIKEGEKIVIPTKAE